MPEFSTPFMASTPTTHSDADIVRAVRFMMSAELEAINQYDLIREHSTNPTVKAVLRSITNEEKRHFGELLALLYTLSSIDRSFAADGEGEVAAILVQQMRPDSPPSTQ